MTCLVAFDEKFSCFSPEEMKPNSRSSQLMQAALTANSLVLKLDHSKNVKKARVWPEFEKAMLLMEGYVTIRKFFPHNTFFIMPFPLSLTCVNV